ncbi:MAG: molybdopterin biosynthesis protein [Candidatus Alkaliphilus sp. MAG34]|mgnify:FL=1|nr:molybdopterin biosynthesis protein [Clostridiales bacterium]
MDRNTYIDNIPVEEAKVKYFEGLNIQEHFEELAPTDALNRVTYEAIYAKMSSPGYNAAAMDGIAVVAAKTKGATEISPVVLVEGEDFSYVNTGNQISNPYDSVIMIEDVIDLGDGRVKILKSAYPWQHIRQIGEDIVATEMIIPSGHIIRPIDLGALISGGIEKLRVYKKPRVGILPTGTEIVEDIKQVTDGKIIDSNSRVFEGLVKEYGGIPNRYAPHSDDYQLLIKAISKGVEENDMLLINAGSSAGTTDYTVKLIEELGEVVVHGVAMQPGKPTILGIINNKPVIGIPGYPVSAYFIFETFVKPVIEKYIGLESKDEDTIHGVLSNRVVSSLKNRELVRLNLGYVRDKLIATPIGGGAGATMSLVKADGIGIIPRNIEGIDAGDTIEINLLKPMSTIKTKLVSIGSHDLIMDVLGDMAELSSGHVGSMGGILSMKRGESHIAPIHLLDEDTGEYNISYVKKYFSEQKMALIKGVKRLQGFIVQNGNPEGIIDFKDLVKEGVTYANRQRGAGTRVLLDYHLKLDNIDPDLIEGYTRELNTHMAVSAAVKTGSATTGLGIYSAAKAMDLDFVDVTYEDYDFLVPYELLEDPRVGKFIELLKSDLFQSRVNKLGGYKFENTGDVITIGS